jgi:hypothetical protein
MPISNTEQLSSLIKSLSKSEKRNFKVYANRFSSSENTRFVMLFDIIDKQKEYNENEVYKKINGISKSQLSNLKRHLYSQILSSMRMIHIQKNIDIQIREQIDFAKILYGKGLYLQALKIMDRVKVIAKKSNQDILFLEIIEFQKLIEERHITRSRTIKNKMEFLIEESEKADEIISNSIKLSNLKLRIHGLYIKLGHVRNEKDVLMVKEYFDTSLKEIKTTSLTFFEKVFLHQCYVWYHYILLDFDKCYHHARLWSDRFRDQPDMISKDPDLYIRGLHYELTCLFNLKKLEEFEKVILDYDNLEHHKTINLNQNSSILLFIYSYLSKLNFHFLKGSFKDGLYLVPIIEQYLDKYSLHLDVHRIMVFYYKIAWLYFGCGEYDKTLDYLNKIIDLKVRHLREDIQGYSRLLNLITHYELQNYNLLEYLLPSVTRFFTKMKDLNPIQVSVLKFLKELVSKRDLVKKDSFKTFRKEIVRLSKTEYGTKAFIYLDVVSWLDSKIDEISITEAIQINLGK